MTTTRMITRRNCQAAPEPELLHTSFTLFARAKWLTVCQYTTHRQSSEFLGGMFTKFFKL